MCGVDNEHVAEELFFWVCIVHTQLSQSSVRTSQSPTEATAPLPTEESACLCLTRPEAHPEGMGKHASDIWPLEPAVSVLGFWFICMFCCAVWLAD